MIRKNSRIFFRFTICLAMCLATAVTSFAQLSNPGKLGLATVWTKAAGTGAGGKITGVHLYVSPTSVYRGTEVVDRLGRRQFFADNEVSVSRAGYDQTQRLTDLKKANLETLGLEPRVEEHTIPDATLYIRSDTGSVTALDAETGQLKWSTRAGTPGYPSHSVAATDEYVVVVSSTSLYLLDANTGQVLETSSMSSLPSGTPTMDGDLIYVPMWKGLIEVFSTENLSRRKFTMGSTSRIMGNLTVCPEVVSWACERGYLYVGNRKRPGLRYRFQSPDTFASAPAFAEGNLFATTLDGFVYAISDVAGERQWRYAAGGSISESPLVVDQMVLAITEDGQLVCLDTKTGDLNWTTSNVLRFVSASENRLYCVTRDSQLAVVDMATGTRIDSQQIGRDDLSFVNTKTDRLYLASADGVVRCLRETGQRWPFVRQEVLDKPDGSDIKVEATEETPEEPVSPSAGDEPPPADEGDVIGVDDVFGDDMGDDPDLDAGADDTGFEDDSSDDDPFADFGE